jgi:hypothetical protein
MPTANIRHNLEYIYAKHVSSEGPHFPQMFEQINMYVTFPHIMSSSSIPNRSACNSHKRHTYSIYIRMYANVMKSSSSLSPLSALSAACYHSYLKEGVTSITLTPEATMPFSASRLIADNGSLILLLLAQRIPE